MNARRRRHILTRGLVGGQVLSMTRLDRVGEPVAFDEELAERVREVLSAEDVGGVAERRMFGGLAFLLDGRMFVGIVGDELMVKLGVEGTVAALRREHVRGMDFTGRPAKGMVFVQSAGLLGESLGRWVHDAAAFARSVPPKSTSSRRRP
jgi:TfoX N-terminal domain